jgi:putative MATE family efflux protein
MRDLTQGPVTGNLIQMAVPIAVGMLAQTLYFLVDLYFVAQLGDAAIAGVSAAGLVMFIVLSLTQTLGVGTAALVSQAVGRKDPNDANLVFNQSLVLAAICLVGTLIGGYALTGSYMRSIGADAATADAGISYLTWFLPGLALQYVSIVMMSALRGTGVVQPTMIVQMVTVLLNVVLAPVLIAGIGTGRPLGVAGAGLASTISVAAGVVLLSFYFVRLEKYVHFRAGLWAPRFAVWGRMLNIGLPAGGEFALMFVYMSVIYWVIRDFGAAAQAGFGVGSRLMQATFLPAMAIAFATGPMAGQNYGAKQYARVRATFRTAAITSSVLMLALTLACQWNPGWLVAKFTNDPEVIAVGSRFLRIISWNFVAQGLIFTCSGIFQGLGHTWPVLASSSSRILTFVLPAIWLSTLPDLQLEYIWYLSVASVATQVIISLVLLHRVMRAKLA